MPFKLVGLKPLFLSSAITLLFALNSFGGTKDGGGGKGVVCRDSSNQITSVETLDLFEARELFGLRTRHLGKSLDDTLNHVLGELKTSMDQPEMHLIPLVDRVREISKFVGPAVVLKPIDDAATVVLPASCQFEQLASYVDDDLLLISQELWDHLDTENKVALILHEAIYRLERYDGAADSRRTRKLVGYAMAGFKFEAVRDSLPANAKYCSTLDGAYSFAYFPITNQGSEVAHDMTKLQFFRYEDRWVFSKKTAVVPIALPWGSTVDGSKCSHPSEGCNITGGSTKSLFEGNGFITIGAQQVIEPVGISRFHYYIVSSDGTRHPLSCLP